MDLHAFTTSKKVRKALYLSSLPPLLIFSVAILSGTRSTAYITEEVTQGSMPLLLTARGALQARNQVDVGSEVSGTVRAVYVRANDTVRAGQVLAELDTERLEALRVQANSLCEVSRAEVQQREVKLNSAHRLGARLRRLATLSGGRLPSALDLEQVDASVMRAAGELGEAHAALALANAKYEEAVTNLSKAQIRSPIDGVVLLRSVEPGQTIASSLRTQELFTLADDLNNLNLRVEVSEADISSLKVGHAATFSVDAFDNEFFEASVERVSLASTATRAITTPLMGESTSSTDATPVFYEAVLRVKNPQRKLRPGMSAVTQVQVATSDSALLVPNEALDFTPSGVPLPSMDSEGRGVLLILPSIQQKWKCPSYERRVLGCVWILEKEVPTLAVFERGVSNEDVTAAIAMERVPTAANLRDLRNDPIFVRAVQRVVRPGDRVVVGEADGRVSIFGWSR